MKVISKFGEKQYKCMSCGYVSGHKTNHYGEIYPKCVNCGWKHPMDFGQVHQCLEKVPKGMTKPENWEKVQIGDICNIQMRNGKLEIMK